jgi:hypothetical protein
MLTQNLPAILGRLSQNSGPLRNCFWNCGQPDELMTTRPSTVNTTSVETSAISVERPPPAGSNREPRDEDGIAAPLSRGPPSVI